MSAPLTPAAAIALLQAGEQVAVLSDYGGPYKVLRIDRPLRKGACFYVQCEKSLPYKVWSSGLMERIDLRLAKATGSPA
jgi:hypothetical protein